MRFTKMHGLGNDYLYVNCFEERVENPAALSVLMSRPHFGAGADGLILIGPSDHADFSMRMYNNDGSESGMCGNGVRCIAKYVYERGLTEKTHITLETGSGIRHLYLNVSDGVVTSVRVDMGVPLFLPAEIPTTLPAKRGAECVLMALHKTFTVTCVNVGNPHAVLFVEDPYHTPVDVIGPAIEHHEAFPERTNVEFARVIARDKLAMRVWERGTGETLACGTGACATLVAAAATGRTDRQASVTLPGGTMHIHWSETDGHVYMTGPAAFVYDGVWLGGKGC